MVNRHDFDVPEAMFVPCEPNDPPWNVVCTGPLALVIVVPSGAVYRMHWIASPDDSTSRV